MLPWGRLIEIPMGWGSSSGTQVSASAPAGGVGYASLQNKRRVSKSLNADSRPMICIEELLKIDWNIKVYKLGRTSPSH